MDGVEKIHFGSLVGNSKVMQDVFELVKSASRYEATILIEGETGTGKELVARAIHNLSPNREERFVAINCTAIPKDLVESELFGHEKGAFTSAHTSRIGKLELARGGSILLDEIGDIDEGIQVKLLRVIEEREFNRVGGNDSIRLNSRIIASTNRPLLKMAAEGRFRDDLYYRLSEFTIYLPPLRERKEDIPLLVEYFIKNGNGSHGDGGKSISRDALDRLMEYDWPGNVRELKNVVNRALVLSHGPLIDVEDIQLPKQETLSKSNYITIPYGLTLDEAEEMIIRHLLKIHSGDKKRVAQVLQISIATLYNKLKRSQSLNPPRDSKI